MRRMLLMLLAAAGCDRVFALIEVPPDAAGRPVDARLDMPDDRTPDAADPGCFSDDFSATSIDQSRWPFVYQLGGSQVEQSAGLLSFKLVSTTEIAYSTVGIGLRDFTNDAIEVEVVEIPYTASTELGMSAQLDGSNRYMYLFGNGLIATRTTVAGNNVDVRRGVTGADRYLRIRFAAGQVAWAHSADRVQWITERTEPTVVPATALGVVLFAGTYVLERVPENPKLDNFAFVCSP